jgi:hypothetical protein
MQMQKNENQLWPCTDVSRIAALMTDWWTDGFERRIAQGLGYESYDDSDPDHVIFYFKPCQELKDANAAINYGVHFVRTNEFFTARNKLLDIVKEAQRAANKTKEEKADE